MGRRFRFVTAVWGFALVAEAVVRTILALTLSTQVFLVVAQIVNWATLGALLSFTIPYIRANERRLTAQLEAESVALPSTGERTPLPNPVTPAPEPR